MHALIYAGITLVFMLAAAYLIIFGVPGGKRQKREAAIRRWTTVMQDVQGGSTLEALMKFAGATHDMRMYDFIPGDIGFSGRAHLAEVCAVAYAKGILDLKPGDSGYIHKGDMFEALERFCIKEEKIKIPAILMKK